ncbi:MAB_1171c family putative transporter [Kutzneria sp. NPDC052558]|uniref:MAB_1171c family putative transporter n=1 Tax=Kutzneria sp. NPDC052558 TaxID=3364121 RepID=UPI0037C90252
MSEIILFAIVGLCWLGLCVRLWDLSRKSGNVALAWVCRGMATLALSVTSQVTSVVAAVDAMSVPDMAGTLSNCLTLVSLTCFQCSFLHMIHGDAEAERRVRPQLWWCGAAVVGVVVLFALFGSNYPEVLATRDSAEQAPVISAGGYLYLGYLAVSVVMLATTSWAYGRLGARFGLRAGMALMSLGLLVGLAYCLVRLAAMISYQLGQHIAFLHGDLIGILFRTAIVLDLVAIMLPYAGARLGLDAWVNSLRVKRSLRALDPLWAALRGAFPTVALADPPDVTPDRLLHRRIIEIWDGRLQLRPWFDPDAAERARTRGDAAVEATLIADALRRRAAGTAPAETATVARPVGVVDDVEWLSRVSKEFARV